MKFKRVNIICPTQIGTTGFMEQDDDCYPKTFVWKKGTVDESHYKAYTYIMIDNQLEWFGGVGLTKEEAVREAEEQAEYYYNCADPDCDLFYDDFEDNVNDQEM
jgi:hypothetical protein